MNTTNTKYKYPAAILVSIPLLILGGCAGNDAKNNIDTSLAESEINKMMEDENLPNQHMDNLPEDMASSVDQSYQGAAETLEVDELVVASEVDEPEIASQETTPKPQEEIIGFAFDESNVNSQYGELLWQHAQYLKENKNLVLYVSGHTDSSGAALYNEALSKKRANEVAKILQEFGAPEEQVKVIAKASDEPLIGAVHHREHRRVELDYQDQQIVSN